MDRKPDLDELTGAIYDAAVDRQAWATALTSITAALRARMATIEIWDRKSDSPPFFAAPGADPDYIRDYLERWFNCDIVREQGLALPVGAVYQLENLRMPRAEFERTPFYNEFWVPQRANVGLFTNAANEAAVVGGIGFYRSWKEGRFDRDEERLLSLLAPHLRRAVALNFQLGRIEMQRGSAVEMLNRCEHGALLVDKRARILFANLAAETILKDGKALRARDGRLAALVPAKTGALHGLIAGDKLGGGTLALPGPDGMSLAVLVLPMKAETAWLAQPPAAIIFVRDPAKTALPSCEQIRLLFDLTPAQAALAHEILRGDGVDAAASRLGISRATARTHLLAVFEKTGTGRQAELVRVILQALPPIRPAIPDHR